MCFWKFPLHVMEDLKNNSLILKKVGKALNKTTQQLNNFQDYTTIHFWFICRLSNNGRLVVPNCIAFWFKIPPLVTFTLAEAFRPVFSVYGSIISPVCFSLMFLSKTTSTQSPCLSSSISCSTLVSCSSDVPDNFPDFISKNLY